MQLSFAQVREHYHTLRQLAYREAENEYAPLKVRLRGISETDVHEADTWLDLHGVKTWSWALGLKKFHKQPKRFDVAITVAGQLCGLCVGSPTRGKLILKVKVLEGLSVGNPLKGNIVLIALFAAHAYAHLLGSIEVWLCNPVNETMVKRYQLAGYEPVRDRSGKVTHMTKET